MPGLERLTQFQSDIARSEIPHMRKPEFPMRREPIRFDGVLVPLQIRDHVLEVAPDKMRQHPTIVNVGAPRHEVLV